MIGRRNRESHETMTQDLAGKVAIVTGGAKGLGYGIQDLNHGLICKGNRCANTRISVDG